MAVINPINPNCPDCNKSGLAILPVRYAVVPPVIKSSLPPHMGNKVKNIKLEHHNYALRTLREGYLYILHEKHPRGSQIKWEIYSVSVRGTLWKQLSPDAIVPVKEDPACSRKGHNIPASIFAVERPEECKRIWIAFSEHKWSKQTFDLYETDGKMRDRRMQTFLPATWIATGGYRHGVEATKTNIEQLIEYQDGFAPSLLVGSAVGTFSKPDGTFDLVSLQKETTCHEMAMRKGQSKALAEAVIKVGERADGKLNKPIIIALWDPIGITHELNGFCNDAAGRVAQYNEERAMELMAYLKIESMKRALETRAGDKARREADIGIFIWSREHTARRLANMERQRPGDANFIARQKELCARWERDNLQKIPRNIASLRDLYTDLPESEWQKKMAEIDSAASRVATTRNPQTGRTSIQVAQEEADRHIGKAVAQAWPKYEGYLRKNAAGKFLHDQFKIEHHKFVELADAIIDDRMDDLIAWLGSKSLLDAMTEFHPSHVGDGVAFDKTIGKAIIGMNASAKGRAKIDAWANEMKASESNLMWRAVALNNDQAIADLNAALAEASKHKQEQTPASDLDWLNYGNKFLKAFADTYKKALSVESANAKALSAKGSKAFGVTLKGINTHGADQLLMTAGDRAFSNVRLNSLTSYASEKIIQHVFSIRAFVEPADSLRLIAEQAKSEGLARAQTLSRLRTARAFLASGAAPIRTAQTESLAQAWEKFKAQGDETSSRALKDARVAMLVLLIEGSNFAKLIADCREKDDAKSWWSLVASGTAITGALFDIASTPAKNLFGADSWTHQRIKGMGGILSASAGAIMAVLDFKDASASKDKGQLGIMILYASKGVLGFTNVGLQIATTFSYAAPLIARLTGNASLSNAARIVSARAAAIIGARILFMCAGAWMTAGIFGIQVFIWSFSDDDLQEWCSLCVFGRNFRAKSAYMTPREQNEALEKALLSVGLAL